jgi:iron(III) transport system substrate-binding protein
MKLVIVSLCALVACSRPSAREVVVYTSVDQPFSQPVFAAFEQQSGIKVRAVFDTEETKSTGVLNRLIAEANSPQADVFWSNDPVRPFVLVDRGLVAPYVSASAAGIPAAFKAADGAWTGIAARARVLLVNRNKVPADRMPKSIQDLIDPAWKGQIAIANPLFGTTTMHVAALFAHWGDDKARAFLAALKANDVRIASSNGEVKRLVVAGEIAFGLTDIDDASEAAADGAAVEIIYPDQQSEGTPVMPTVVVLMKNAPHGDSAKQLVDYLLSVATETRMTKSAHMPLRADVSVPPALKPVSQIRAFPMDYPAVAKTMERIQPLLREWTGL